MNYARAIRVARAAKGLSQKQLAAASERDQSYISKLESGKRAPSQRVLQAIADGLKIPRILLTILASEREDLQGLPKSEKLVQELGGTLLDLLLAIDDEMEKSPSNA